MQYLHVRTLKTISDIDLLLTVENLENGYYVPEEFPSLTAKDLLDLSALPFSKRLAKLLSAFFPSFSVAELQTCVDKHFADLNKEAQVKPLNDFMPVHLAELDNLPSGSIYDYVLPLLIALQESALSKKPGDSAVERIYSEHNLGNSSFSSLVQALAEGTLEPKAQLYYNPKRINNAIHKRISAAYGDKVDLIPVDNALSLPTLSLFAGRFRKIKAQVEEASGNGEDVSVSTDVAESDLAALQKYPQATRSSLDSLSAVLIATALQLTLAAELPIKKEQNKQIATEESGRKNKPRYTGPEYRPINLFLPAKQGYLLLAACYAKVICPLIDRIYLAGMRGNFLCELVRNGKFEVKGKQNTFELPVQLERMLFEFVSRDNEKSLALLNEFALKGTLQLTLGAKHNINGLIMADLFTEKQEEKFLLNIYDRFDLLLPPLSVLAFASYLKHYEQQKHQSELALIFVNASIYRYALKVAKAIFSNEQLKGLNFLQTMQLLSFESGESFPTWFMFEQDIAPEAVVNDDRFDPDKHREEFEKIRFEGLSREDIAALF